MSKLIKITSMMGALISSCPVCSFSSQSSSLMDRWNDVVVPIRNQLSNDLNLEPSYGHYYALSSFNLILKPLFNVFRDAVNERNGVIEVNQWYSAAFVALQTACDGDERERDNIDLHKKREVIRYLVDNHGPELFTNFISNVKKAVEESLCVQFQ